MSLINKMLKDLDDRRGKQSSSQVNVLAGVISVEEENQAKRKKIIYVSIVSVIILFIILSLLLLRMSKPLHQYFHDQHEYLPNYHHKADVFHKSIASPSLLTMYSVNKQNGQTFLTLNFNKPIQGGIKHWQVKNTVYLYLNNTKLPQSFKTTELNNDVFSKINVSEDTKNHLQFSVVLMPGVVLHNIAIQQYPKTTLQLEFITDVKMPHKKPALIKPTAEIQASTSVKQQGLVKTNLPLSNLQQTKINMESAMEFANNGENVQAITQLNLILEKNPIYKPARQMLATLYFQQGNLSKAEQLLRVGLQQAPEYSQYAELLGHVLISQNKLKQALDVLQSAVPNLSDDPDYFALMANVQQRLGHSASAARLYEQIIRLEPDNPKLWLGLAIAFRESGQESLALKAFQKSQDIGGLSPQLQQYVSQQIDVLEG